MKTNKTVGMSVARARREWPSLTVKDKTDEQIRQMIIEDERMTLVEKDARGGKAVTDSVVLQRKIKAILTQVNCQIDGTYKDRKDQKVFCLGVLLLGLKSICEKHGVNPDEAMDHELVQKYAEHFTPDNLPGYDLEKVKRSAKATESTPESGNVNSDATSDTAEKAVLEVAV